jgi:DNA repair protein SbcC/Rad50
VSLSEAKKHDEFVSQIKEHNEKEKAIERKRASLKKDIDVLLKEKHHQDVINLKFKNIDDKRKQKEDRLLLKEKTRKDIGSLNSKKAELGSKIASFADIEARHSLIRKDIDALLPQERFLESEKKSMEKEKEMILRFSAGLEKEISEKRKAKEKLSSISRMITWLDEFFISLMSSMEKHVMASIHTQFNELLQNWFDVLIEDETINIRVDEEFTPIIEQNGYETYIENLSGGEKTSVALAYRLALNKVVNDVISAIKTKDMIILDEPTDGFSSEQLDRMRDLLKELNMRQVIIVSHESKIESFVQNVIRIEKREHLSVVG